VVDELGGAVVMEKLLVISGWQPVSVEGGLCPNVWPSGF
jgi:hypothetical protein